MCIHIYIFITYLPPYPVNKFFISHTSDVIMDLAQYCWNNIRIFCMLKDITKMYNNNKLSLKYVIKRITQGLWLDMILYIYTLQGIKNLFTPMVCYMHSKSKSKSITTEFYLYMFWSYLNTPSLSIPPLSVLYHWTVVFELQLFSACYHFYDKRRHQCNASQHPHHSTP